MNSYFVMFCRTPVAFDDVTGEYYSCSRQELTKKISRKKQNGWHALYAKVKTPIGWELMYLQENQNQSNNQGK